MLFYFSLKGVRILGTSGLTDSEEAQALNHHLSGVDIYSNSWGPTDGYDFSEPGTITKSALLDGITSVRLKKQYVAIRICCSEMQMRKPIET